MGPDGPAEPKENARFGPAFPPKGSDSKKVPEDVKGMVIDPRIAPDSNADFDEKRVPLGRSTDQTKQGMSSIPRALVFYPQDAANAGVPNSQGVRVSVSQSTTIVDMKIQEPHGPFQFKKKQALPLSLKDRAGAIIEIQCNEGAVAHETTLTIESSTGSLTVPLRYFPIPQ